MGAGAAGWAALALLLGVGAALGALLTPPRIDWQPALAGSEPWRAWSAAWAHLSTRHLLANLLGCVLVGALGLVARLPVRSSIAWLLAWPLTHWGLLLRPDLLHYAGLSGVLHAGVAVAGIHLVVAGRGPRQAIGAAVLAGLAIKVLGESPWGPALSQPPQWDIAIAPFAHASGLAAGILGSLVAEAAGALAGRRGDRRSA